MSAVEKQSRREELASGEQIRTVGERRRGSKCQGENRVRKDRGPTHCTGARVKRHSWVGTRRRQELYPPEWHKGLKEPEHGEDHSVAKAKE